MRKTKTILWRALLLLLSLSLLLVGCKKEPEPEEQEPTPDDVTDDATVTEIDVREIGEVANVSLVGYTLKYPANASAAFREEMTLLGERLYRLTGEAVQATHFGGEKVIEAKVDSTDADISGYGFAIKREGDRITIVGTTALLAQMGVDYFTGHYLVAATVSLPELVISDELQMISLSSDGEERYYVVYSADADTRNQTEDEIVSGDPDTYYGKSSESGCDYAYDVAETIKTLVPSSSTRKDTKGEKPNEILVGMTNRAETATALSLLKGHEYGIMVIEDHVVITGYSTAALHKAAPIFYDYLSDAMNEDGEVLFPRNLCMIGEASDRWLTDIPMPDGLPLYSTADDGDGVFQYLFSGSAAVNAAAFDSYVARLVAVGYQVISSNSAEGSHFKTFKNADGSQMIHVAYNAYAHASDNKAGGEWLYSSPAIRVTTAYTNSYYGHVNDTRPSGYDYSKGYKTYESGWREIYYFNPVQDLAAYVASMEQKGYTVTLEDEVAKAASLVNSETGERIYVRIANDKVVTTGNTSYTYALAVRYLAPGVVELPDSTLLDSNQVYDKVTDAKIVPIDLSAVSSMGLSGSYGTGYVMMLEDGRFVIVDGGAADGGTSGQNAFAQVENFWSIVKSLYAEVYGHEPTVESPAHIAAWIITHAHGDHMNMFWDFADRYGGGAGPHSVGAYVKLDYLIATTPDYTMQYNTGEPNMTMNQELAKYRRYFKYGFTYLKVQTGQQYYFANLEIETLFTHGDLQPQRIVTFNDTSTVQRLYFRSTADGTGRRVVDHANTDLVTTSFLSTGDSYRWGGRWLAAMYGNYLQSDMVSVSHHGGPGWTAEVYDLVSPTAVCWSMGKSAAYGGYSTSNNWYSLADQHLVYEIRSVTYVFVADDHHITIVLKESGADYDGIYDAVTKEKISYLETDQKHVMYTEKSVAVKKK